MTTLKNIILTSENLTNFVEYSREVTQYAQTKAVNNNSVLNWFLNNIANNAYNLAYLSKDYSVSPKLFLNLLI